MCFSIGFYFPFLKLQTLTKTVYFIFNPNPSLHNNRSRGEARSAEFEADQWVETRTSEASESRGAKRQDEWLKGPGLRAVGPNCEGAKRVSRGATRRDGRFKGPRRKV